MRPSLSFLSIIYFLGASGSLGLAGEPVPPVDFNHDIRPILSDKCFQCHGPDKSERQGGTDGLRLDTEEGAMADVGGYAVIVRGKPEESELIRRISSRDESEIMPPAESGKHLSPQEIERLKRWIKEGAKFARHWSYVKPLRPAIPKVKQIAWPQTEVDAFILSRLEKEGLKPSPRADRYTLIRRLSLDLTGLPPTLAEVEEFVKDQRPEAYELLVDRLLAKETFGEHWARMWLDLARYADSAGYADDPPRTIWAYRDYVIRALNANKPFDQFTIEQIAGDLLPNPTKDQLTATAFHRNTLTNNEGGTTDEEFRNVAIVDRVNTTMAVWMGTTMACAQCHTHKFDPISQAEYFQMFAFFNGSQDADRRDESPLLDIYTAEQLQQKAAWQTEIAKLEKRIDTFTPELKIAQSKWEARLNQPIAWKTIRPAEVLTASQQPALVAEDGTVLVEHPAETETYTVQLPFERDMVISAIQLEALPHEKLPAKGPGHAKGQFVISQISAQVVPPDNAQVAGRFVRIEVPGDQKILSLAEVQVFTGGKNIAPQGKATQSSTAYEGPARLAIDGNTDGDYFKAKSTTHTAISKNPWWQLDLGKTQPLENIVIWNRTDGGTSSRLNNFKIILLDEEQKPVWEKTVSAVPNPSSDFALREIRRVKLKAALADFTQAGFNAGDVIRPKANGKKSGWAIGPQVGKPHELTLLPESPLSIPAGSVLSLKIEQSAKKQALGHFRVRVTENSHAGELAKVPPAALAILQIAASGRSEKQREELSQAFLATASELEPERQKLAKLKKQLADQKPATTVPIMRELPENNRRTTKIQVRGNYLITEGEVREGVPAAFHPLPPISPKTAWRWRSGWSMKTTR